MKNNVKTSEPCISVFVCPICDALCVEGHDEDFQQHCGNCGSMFNVDPNEAICVNTDYLNLCYKPVEKHHHGWLSYVKLCKN